MIVTIDGPAGAGKSSVAKQLAKRLGFQFLDTGAMYRAVAWFLSQTNVSMEDVDAVIRSLDQIQIQMQGERVLVNGKDVARFLRDKEISQRASQVATIPEVRSKLVSLQRQIAAHGDFVCEGRDQGTVAFPDSKCKVFLTASPEIRAERRWLEMRVQQPDLELVEVVAEQKIRDLRDESRAIGRLEKAVDAVEIRVDSLTLGQVIEQIESLVRSAMADTA